MVSLEQSVTIPDDVLVRIVDGEAVLLNLDNEMYYALDAVSTDFWSAIVETTTLEEAVARLQGQFDVNEDTLHSDFNAFVVDLLASGLLVSNE